MKGSYFLPGETHEQIGATCHHICKDGKNIIIDCGNGRHRINGIDIKYIPDIDFLKKTKIDLILITHQHDDHIGALPYFLNQHPEARIIMSETAYRTSPVIFKDALTVMKKRDEPQLFTGQDVRRLLNHPLLKIIGPDEIGWARDPWPGWEGWEIGTHPSGHYIGALSFFIVTPSGDRIMVTGDTSRHDQETVPGVMLPDKDFLGDFLDGDVTMITEGTNAARNRKEPREKIVSDLVNFVDEVGKRRGVVLIPTFARQRASEVGMTLIKAGYSIHIDGIAREFAALEAPELAKNSSVVFFDSPSRKWINIHRRQIAKGYDPCLHEPPIVISPAATLEGGPSVEHTIRLMGDPKNAIILVGYIFPHTPTHQLYHHRKFNGEKAECEVRFFDLSAHDYQEDLLERISLVKPKRLIVHHCPGPEDYKIFKQKAEKLLNPPEHIYYAPTAGPIEI